MDVHDPKTRSYNMSKIQGKNTKPENLVRKYLHSRGLRFRLHDRKLPGKPDLVLIKYRTAIQVNGCFWHGHTGCKYFIIPKTRSIWWAEKIEQTKVRDQNNSKLLENRGWKTFVVWECELKNNKLDRLQSLYTQITC